MSKPQGVIARWPVLPGTPAESPPAGYILVYIKATDGKVYTKNSSGVETPVDSGGGGGGADLLSGLGAPSNAVGAAGDFYFDDTNDVLYGPRAAGTGAGSPYYAQAGSNTPDTTTVGDYRLGSTFQVLVDGQVTGLRFYRNSAAAVQARTLTLYENGVLVATSNPTSETATTGWVTATLSTPVTVVPGREYTVAYRTPSSGPYVSTTTTPTMTDSAQVAWVTGRYDVGTAGFPSIATATNFFLDLEFTPSSSVWPLALESGGDPIAQIVPTEPVGAVEGLLWYDSDDDQFLVDVSYVQDNEPTGAAEGALWLDTDDPAAHTGADHTDLAPLDHTHPALTLASTPATSPTDFPDGLSTSYWDATALGTPTPKTNLQTDPSFEASTLLPVSGAVTQSISTDWSDTGTKSLKLVSTGGGSTGDCYAGYATGGSAAPMQPGKTYTIAATVYTPVAQTGAVHTRARRITAHVKAPSVNGGAYVEYDSNQGPVTGEGRVSLTIDIPADATEYLLRFYNGSPTSGEAVYWDDISITEGPSGDGKTWTVETAKWSDTVIHQTVSERDATPEGDELIYFRTGYQGGSPEWGPWQQLVTNVSHGPAIQGSDQRLTVGGVGPRDPSWYTARHMRYAPEFLNGSELGLPKAQYAVETIVPWSSDSGGGVHQVARGYGETWERYGLRSGAWGPWRVPGGGWQQIATVVPSGSTSTIGNLSFTNIPSVYKRLRIRSSYLKAGATASSGHLYMRFNSISASQYNHWLGYHSSGSWSGTTSSSQPQGYAAYNYFYSTAGSSDYNKLNIEIACAGIGDIQWKSEHEVNYTSYPYASQVHGELNTYSVAVTRIDLWASFSYTWDPLSVVTLEGSLEI